MRNVILYASSPATEPSPHPNLINPQKFIQCVHQIAEKKDWTIFTGFAQNDMTEFLLFFMDTLHQSIKRPQKRTIRGKTENTTDELAISCYKVLQKIYETEYSEILDTFYGISVSRIISLDQKKTIYTTNPEHYFLLDIPITSNNIYNCLDAYVSPELLEKENAWKNDKTGENENVYKQITFWNFPKILVISLKRFIVEGRYIRKNNERVYFPIDDFNLSKYVEGYNASKYQYDLYGVCNHVGDVMGGHYTAFVKNPVSGEWFYCNDTAITKMEQQTLPQQLITPMAYCLFYRKKNNFL